MVTVCLTCGGSGFELALDKCYKCQNYAVHRYCRKVLPKDLSEDTIWYCEDCEPGVASQCVLENSGSPESEFSASAKPDAVQSNKLMREYKNQSISTTTSESEMEDDLSEGRPHGDEPQRREKDNNDRALKRRRILFLEEEEADEDRHLDTSEVTVSDLRPLKNSNGKKETIVNSSQAKIKDGELRCEEQCNNDIKLGSGRLVLEDDELMCTNNNDTKLRKQRKLILEDEEAQPRETFRDAVNDSKPLDVLQKKLVASSGAKTMVQIRESKCSGVDLQHGVKCDNDAKLGGRRRLILEEEEEEGEEEGEEEEAQPLVTSRVPVSDDVKASNISQQKSRTASEAEKELQIREAKHSGDEAQCRKKSDKDQKLRKQHRFVTEELGAEPLKTSRAAVSGQKSSNFSEKRVISGSVAQKKALYNDQPSATQHREKDYKDHKFIEQPRSKAFSNTKPSNILQRKVILEKTHDSRPSGTQHKEKLGKDQKPRKQRRLVLEDADDDFLATSQLAVNEHKTSNTVEEKLNNDSAAKAKMEINGSRPSSNERQYTQKCHDDMKFGKQRRLVHDGAEVKSLKTSGHSHSDPKPSYKCDDRRAGNELEHRDRCVKDFKLEKQKGLVLEDEGVEPLKISRVSVADVKSSKILELKVASGSVDKPKAHIPIRDNKPSGILHTEKYIKRQKLRRETTLVRDDEEANPLKSSRVPVNDAKLSNISQQNVITSASVSRPKMQIVDNRSACNEPPHRDKYNMGKNLGERRRTSQPNVICGSIDNSKLRVFDRSAGNEQRCRSDMGQNLREKQRNSHVRDPQPSNMSQQNAISGSTDKMNVRMCGGRSVSKEPQHREHCDNDQQLGDRWKMSQFSDPKPSNILHHNKTSGFEDKMKVQSGGGNKLSANHDPQYMEKRDKDPKFRAQPTLLRKEGAARELKPSHISEQIFCDTLPMEDPVWRGTLRIISEGSNTVNRLLATAHLSTLANSKASDMAKLFPECVFLETFGRSQLWPECFQKSGPSSHHIALYFFPDSRDELFFDRLIDKMHRRDLAMRAVHECAELLIFSSYVLPMNCRMIRSKYFLWGVFRSKQESRPADMSRSHPSNIEG